MIEEIHSLPGFTPKPRRLSRLPTDAGPVILINLTVSLEWMPGETETIRQMLTESECTLPEDDEDRSYVEDLKLAFECAAEYLFCMSGGTFSLGAVRIYLDGEKWPDADVCVLANAAYRPAAFVGGIVASPTEYKSALDDPPISWEPRPIFLGRFWNGRGARCGPWSAPEGWRTIGHELAHYALFLFDQYVEYPTTNASGSASILQGLNCSGLHILGPNEPAPWQIDRSAEAPATAMCYHYTADRLELADLGCGNTAQQLIHGIPEWETVRKMYGEAVGQPTNDVSTLQTVWEQAVKPECVVSLETTFHPTTDRTRQAECAPSGSDGVGNMEPVIGQAYLVRRDGDMITHIIGEGNLVVTADGEPTAVGRARESLLYLGVSAANESARDQGLVIVPFSAADGVPVFDDIFDVDDREDLERSARLWCPALVITPFVPVNQGGQALETVTALNVEVRVNAMFGPAPDEVELTYCAAGTTCTSLGTQTVVDGTARFQVPDPEPYGYLHLRGLPEDGVPRETVTWYQLSGGVGPASIEGHPALAEGLVNVEALQNVDGTPAVPRGAYVLYSQARFCFPNALRQGNLRLAGDPLYVQIALPGGIPLGTVAERPRLMLRVNYDLPMLERWASGMGDEWKAASLAVARFSPDGSRRQTNSDAIQRDPEQNWIALDVSDFSPDGEIIMLAHP